MENRMPKHIVSEKDLQNYEDYINNFNDNSQNTIGTKHAAENRVTSMQIENRRLPMPQNRFSIPQALTSPVFSNGYLRNHQGKLVKIESLIGNALDSRIGILLDIGADYIAIKLNKSCCSMMIPTSAIKYITIIHDNDISKAARY